MITRKINPLTGDYEYVAASRALARADSTELALVQNVLRVARGSAGHDPTFGVEPVDNAAPNATAVWRQNVLNALQRWIKRGVIRDVEVVAEIHHPATGAELRYRVSFTTARGLRQTYAGTR